MLKTPPPPSQPSTKLYFKIKHQQDARLEQLNFGEPDNRAEKILGALVMKYATGSAKKNFLKAGKEYELEFNGEKIQVICPRDIFIISKKRPQGKQEILDLSIRFFQNNYLGEKEILGSGSFGVVRRLSEEKCHINFSEEQPIAVKKEVHHRKLVKEVEIGAPGISLAEENNLFGLVHDGTGRGTSRDQVYDDLDPLRPLSRMVMAEFKGDTLNKVITQNLSIVERFGIACGVVKQVQKVHEIGTGYIVSDLKLENFMHSREERETRIIDAAFSKLNTPRYRLLTSPYTKPPEKTKAAEFSADVYSLGVVISSILVGQSYGSIMGGLFSRVGKNYDDFEKFLTELSNGKHVGYGIRDFIRKIPRDVPEEVIKLLVKMTDKNPDKRPKMEEVLLVLSKAEKGVVAKKELMEMLKQVSQLNKKVEDEIQSQELLITAIKENPAEIMLTTDKLLKLKAQFEELNIKLASFKKTFLPEQEAMLRSKIDIIDSIFGKLKLDIPAEIQKIDEANHNAENARELMKKITFEIGNGYDYYQKLLSKSSEDVSIADINEIIAWCGKVKQLTGGQPCFNKISKEIFSLQTKLDKIVKKKPDGKIVFFKDPVKITLLKALNTCLEKICLSSPKIESYVKEYREKREQQGKNEIERTLKKIVDPG